MRKQWQRLANQSMLFKLIVVAVLMFGFGYALIPIYEKICELTGVNVITRPDKEANETRVLDKTRSITIEFDSNTKKGWKFAPAFKSMQVYPGQIARIDYQMTSPFAQKVSVQAIPSYAPQESGQFFKKLECFCFKQQDFAPYETKTFPVVFYIDAKLPKQVNTITLSYTFFEVEGGG